MKVTIEKRPDGSVYLRIDVTDEFATTARIRGRNAQHIFALAQSSLLGFSGTIFYVRGKRGISNDGFVALVKGVR